MLGTKSDTYLFGMTSFSQSFVRSSYLLFGIAVPLTLLGLKLNLKTSGSGTICCFLVLLVLSVVLPLSAVASPLRLMFMKLPSIL